VLGVRRELLGGGLRAGGGQVGQRLRVLRAEDRLDLVVRLGQRRLDGLDVQVGQLLEAFVRDCSACSPLSGSGPGIGLSGELCAAQNEL